MVKLLVETNIPTKMGLFGFKCYPSIISIKIQDWIATIEYGWVDSNNVLHTEKVERIFDEIDKITIEREE